MFPVRCWAIGSALTAATIVVAGSAGPALAQRLPEGTATVPATSAAIAVADNRSVGELRTGRPAGTDVTARTASSVFANMTLRQRIGQVFMVGTPATSASGITLSQISRYHVGNVMLTGRSVDGTAGPARTAAAMQGQATAAATAGVRLFVATDQEGGQVQVLRGAGLSDMPTALTQGTWSTAGLQSAATTWGRQLRTAGVNMNLAPVMDTVPDPVAARDNAPIGYYQRQFGFTTSRVARMGTAFARGMAAAGVAPTIKHFPSLGRVTANTDTSSRVTDQVTRRGDPYLDPFSRAIDSGQVPFVMMSSAYYTRLDNANPAAFSPYIINTILRGDLGFTGAVISDDMANARQVAAWPYGSRAVKFLRAGGDVVLTVEPTTLPAMYDAVLQRAHGDARFRAKVNDAALTVLKTKERRDLLGP